MKTAEKVAFLKQPESYPRGFSRIDVCETHTAFVFIADDRAYKLKKPVRLPYLDFSTLEAREHFCREEVWLNGRLAPHIYLGVVALCESRDGSLNLAGDGKAIDWLVEMIRLPDDDMLAERLAQARVTRQEIESLAERLSVFYREQMQTARSGKAYVDHLLRETAINRNHLDAMQGRLVIPIGGGLSRLCEERLTKHLPEIEARISAGLVVEGHGDLRPEHVCLLSPPVIFDRLEFDADMRLIDIYDEVNYLGLECEMLGCSWARTLLLSHTQRKIGHPPSPELMSTYGVFRLLLRARLAIDHLLDEHPRDAEKWPVQARAYLLVAQQQVNAAVSAP